MQRRHSGGMDINAPAACRYLAGDKLDQRTKSEWTNVVKVIRETVAPGQPSLYIRLHAPNHRALRGKKVVAQSQHRTLI